MSLGTVMILMAIGITAGILSGFVGVGGGMVIVPCLIYFLGISQFEAQGTSLALMLPPIGILAFLNYKATGNVNIAYAVVIGITFIAGAYLGSKWALKLSEAKVKLIFGIIMLYVSITMIRTAFLQLNSAEI